MRQDGAEEALDMQHRPVHAGRALAAREHDGGDGARRRHGADAEGAGQQAGLRACRPGRSGRDAPGAPRCRPPPSRAPRPGPGRCSAPATWAARAPAASARSARSCSAGGADAAGRAADAEEERGADAERSAGIGGGEQVLGRPVRRAEPLRGTIVVAIEQVGHGLFGDAGGIGGEQAGGEAVGRAREEQVAPGGEAERRVQVRRERHPRIRLPQRGERGGFRRAARPGTRPSPASPARRDRRAAWRPAGPVAVTSVKSGASAPATARPSAGSGGTGASAKACSAAASSVSPSPSSRPSNPQCAASSARSAGPSAGRRKPVRDPPGPGPEPPRGLEMRGEERGQRLGIRLEPGRVAAGGIGRLAEPAGNAQRVIRAEHIRQIAAQRDECRRPQRDRGDCRTVVAGRAVREDGEIGERAQGGELRLGPVLADEQHGCVAGRGWQPRPAACRGLDAETVGSRGLRP